MRRASVDTGGKAKGGAVAALVLAGLVPSLAQAAPVGPGGGDLGSWLALVALLSLAPFALVMLTSFVKIAVVLHILRSALGSPTLPPTMVITGLAAVLSLVVMAPTGARVAQAVRPVLSGNGASAGERGGPEQAGWGRWLVAAEAARGPVQAFLEANSSSEDRQMFRRLVRDAGGTPGGAGGGGGAQQGGPSGGGEALLAAVPAFAVGQLEAAFQIGFLLFIPFLIIDLLVANVLLAAGLHALNPASVALPFKLLLFVMADGWSLLARGLILSFG